MNMMFEPPIARMIAERREYGQAVHLDLDGVIPLPCAPRAPVSWNARCAAILAAIVVTLAVGFAAIPGAAHAVLPQLF